MRKPTVQHHSCQPGIDRCPSGDLPRIRDGLNVIFGYPSRSTYYNHIRDYPNIPHHIKLKIDELFSVVCNLEPKEIWRTWYDDPC